MSDIIQIMGKMMDVCEVRHRTLANNLANANTAGYLRKDVQFKEAMAEAIRKGDMEALSRFSPKTVVDRERPAGENGNNVTAQDELSQMAENSLLYGLSTKVVNYKFAGLRKAIAGK